jgi:hypothetical protein
MLFSLGEKISQAPALSAVMKLSNTMTFENKKRFSGGLIMLSRRGFLGAGNGRDGMNN